MATLSIPGAAVLLVALVLVVQEFPPSSADVRTRGRTSGPRIFFLTEKSSPSPLDEYGVVTTRPWTTTAGILRGDQTPPPDAPDDREMMLAAASGTLEDEMPIFYQLGGFNVHPLQSTRSTRIPYYSVNYNFRAYRPQQRVHPCEHSSCYPATGNLLIGRENRLYASSTCGLNGPERFCIVSHLEDTKCFLCDTRLETENDPLKNHRIGQIIYKNQPGTLDQTWWQSENGKENVTIQLDLEAEFHFTHLILVFATFRPAAMLVERSYDFGQTWHVYRYFAYNCHESFPNVPTVSGNITDVICDTRYSAVEPSKNGEVIFRVLPPNMKVANPYAQDVQNVLKMTNLRVNFTKLHTLGDTLLDDRQEIQEKYYYGISNMIVRGSCSCYGHASRCLPLENVVNKYDMVHGRCECTHNTKGLNCEQCEDFYNDLPWKPALGKQTNACRRCNCNNHAQSCHFDSAVYESSGRVSGGVCDSCEHNTQGQHCEQCMPYFYRDPNEDIQSPYVCRACDCDPRGSKDDGICDSVTDERYNLTAGRCHCKDYVEGRRCDTCKRGKWNFREDNPLGCENCTCNTLGTVDNLGCNVYTGECTCKRLVTGRNCDQCMPETFGLSDEPEGCKPCDCDPGGALDNFCDVISGQCRCRPHMKGRQCSEPIQNYFVPGLHHVIEAEEPYTVCENQNNWGNCSIVLTERTPHTGPGFVRAYEGTTLTFTVDDLPKTMTYDIVLRYSPQMKQDWEDVRVTLKRPEPIHPDSFCSYVYPEYERDRPLVLSEYESSTVALGDVCLETGKVYKFVIEFHRHNRYEDNPTAQILIDSLSVIPKIEVTPIFKGDLPADIRLQEWVRLGCNRTFYSVNYEEDSSEACKDLYHTVSIYVANGATPCDCDPTGAISHQCAEFGGFCQCIGNVVGRRCDQCAPATYGFGPSGCKACDCNSIGSKTTECDLVTGQCDCHPNTYGRQCDQCQPGFWNFPNCQQCQCNGHTQVCDSRTGECLGCQDYTTGANCERCIDGYYGDAYLGSEIRCRPCSCPDTIASGHSHADLCALIPQTNDVVCYCREGYAGAKCDVCADNYWGNPHRPGGVCQACNCSGNVDYARPGNCDARTGACLQCLWNTGGDHCEHCKDGFWGDAALRTCRQCDCELLGTDANYPHCDRYDGQCHCLPNVTGIRCDQCKENHWKIASGEGCEACNCFLDGAHSSQCNPYDGQCECRQGYGGRQCDQCETNFWGEPGDCKPCQCNPYGSATDQCDRVTGQCVCLPGIGGHKCDQCARGYLGNAPYCSACGECFDNWDLILEQLKERTALVLDEAKQIKTLGATGAYTKEFDAMAKQIAQIQELLENTTIDSAVVNEIETDIDRLSRRLNASRTSLLASERDIDTIQAGITIANANADRLRNRSEEVKAQAGALRDNATKLQEANVEGALNLTRDALMRVHLLGDVQRETLELSANADKKCRSVEQLLGRNQPEYERLGVQNDELIDKIQRELDDLNAKVPPLNRDMCGGVLHAPGEVCDPLCGGAGCGSCGASLTCENGALTKAEKAHTLAKEAEEKGKAKEDEAAELIRSMSQARNSALEGYRKALGAYRETQAKYNETEAALKQVQDRIQALSDTVNNNTGAAERIEQIAKDTLAFDLSLDPEEIKKLAVDIDNTVRSLENVDSIIASTRNDMDRVEDLKQDAEWAKKQAQEVLERAENVVKALEEAGDAQSKASKAISQARDDINSAKIDLEQIDNETVDAKTRANNTAGAVESLQARLNNLQKYILTNDLDVREIKERADNVTRLASDVHDAATQLRNDYRTANTSLTNRAKDSEDARERAQVLLNRASQITVDTTSKLKELQAMSDTYKMNNRDLGHLEQRINYLNEIIDESLGTIQARADDYRQCTS